MGLRWLFLNAAMHDGNIPAFQIYRMKIHDFLIRIFM